MRPRPMDVLDQQALSVIGRAVRIARERSALSQRALAALSGVSQSAISRLERGRVRGMGLIYFARVVRALGESMTLVGCPHGHDCDYERRWTAVVRQVALEQEWAAGPSIEGPTLFELIRQAEWEGDVDVPG